MLWDNSQPLAADKHTFTCACILNSSQIQAVTGYKFFRTNAQEILLCIVRAGDSPPLSRSYLIEDWRVGRPQPTCATPPLRGAPRPARHP